MRVLVLSNFFIGFDEKKKILCGMVTFIRTHK